MAAVANGAGAVFPAPTFIESLPMKTLFATVLFALATLQAGAQLHVLRTVEITGRGDFPATARSSTTDSAVTADIQPHKLLPSTTFVGELQRGFGSAGGDRAWNIRIGGRAELYRWPSASLHFTAASELSANPYNDIGFNPRTAVWEEQLLFSASDGWQAGIFHRCKHEIDNSDAPTTDEPVAGYKPTKRVLILSGLAASWSRGIRGPGDTEIHSLLRAEWYPLRSDYRYPENSEGRSWDSMHGSLMAALWWGALLYEKNDEEDVRRLFAYTRLWAAGMLFGRERDLEAGVEYNTRAEAGLKLQSKAARLDVFIAWEYMFDEPASIVPKPSHVVFIGARLGPPGL